MPNNRFLTMADFGDSPEIMAAVQAAVNDILGDTPLTVITVFSLRVAVEVLGREVFMIHVGCLSATANEYVTRLLTTIPVGTPITAENPETLPMPPMQPYWTEGGWIA